MPSTNQEYPLHDREVNFYCVQPLRFQVYLLYSGQGYHTEHKYHKLSSRSTATLEHKLIAWIRIICFRGFSGKTFTFLLLTLAYIKSLPAFPKSKELYMRKRNN